MTSEEGTHSCFRNVVNKFTSNTVRKKNRNQKNSFHGENLKSNLQVLFACSQTLTLPYIL